MTGEVSGQPKKTPGYATGFDGGVTQRSRRGSLADRAVQTKRRAAEALLSQIYVSDIPVENVYSFEYLGARMQCDRADDADVRHRMNGHPQTTSGSLSSIWTDRRLSRALKLRTYQLAVCSTLTHASESWAITEPVMRSVNGFNSRCLHVLTGQDCRVTATAQHTTCFVRFASAASFTSAISYACPRLGWCDAPCWHSQRAAPSTLRKASWWTAMQWRWTS